jgi:ABC-type branched-subunit amino acid transport system permease subunit
MGAVAAGALGALIAFPARRLGVLALALASLAIALALDLTLFQVQDVSNGQLGWTYPLPRFDLFGITTFDLSQPRTEVMVLLVIFGVMTLGIHNLQQSSSGRAALAVRSSSVAARTSGIAPARSEIALFAVAGAIAGFGGVMLGMTNGSFSNSTATPITGLLWLAVVVTFGIRRPGGALLGGLAVMATTPVFNWISGWSFMPAQQPPGSTYFVAILFRPGGSTRRRTPTAVCVSSGSASSAGKKERLAGRAGEARRPRGGRVPASNADPARAPTTDPIRLAPRGMDVRARDPGGALEDAALALDIVAGYGASGAPPGVAAPGPGWWSPLGRNGAEVDALCGHGRPAGAAAARSRSTGAT